MRQHISVVVGVDDMRAGPVLVRQLMHIPLRRQARPDIDELADTILLRKELHNALEEFTILQRCERDIRRCPEHTPGRFPVCRIVIPAAQVIVVHAGNVRLGEIYHVRRIIMGHGLYPLFLDRRMRSTAVAHALPALLFAGVSRAFQPTQNWRRVTAHTGGSHVAKMLHPGWWPGPRSRELAILCVSRGGQSVSLKRLRLIQRRKALGYTQEALAERIGCERTTVIRWERAETEPQPWVRARLTQALQLTPDELNELLADVSDVPGDREGRIQSVIASHGGSVDSIGRFELKATVGKADSSTSIVRFPGSATTPATSTWNSRSTQ